MEPGEDQRADGVCRALSTPLPMPAVNRPSQGCADRAARPRLKPLHLAPSACPALLMATGVSSPGLESRGWAAPGTSSDGGRTDADNGSGALSDAHTDTSSRAQGHWPMAAQQGLLVAVGPEYQAHGGRCDSSWLTLPGVPALSALCKVAVGASCPRADTPSRSRLPEGLKDEALPEHRGCHHPARPPGTLAGLAETVTSPAVLRDLEPASPVSALISAWRRLNQVPGPQALAVHVLRAGLVLGSILAPAGSHQGGPEPRCVPRDVTTPLPAPGSWTLCREPSGWPSDSASQVRRAYSRLSSVCERQDPAGSSRHAPPHVCARCAQGGLGTDQNRSCFSLQTLAPLVWGWRKHLEGPLHRQVGEPAIGQRPPEEPT
ncbi:uncharacterized protein LOC106734940 [Tupaia chinensis]|uniref:uncharacterized protein LOC106734940 n=1 Tax=Tupaia chinensis TaxID=246437 RepID=UPI0007042CA5|nr:uncharacterized protein LOC106734940 [Tupaia chinensis]